MQEAEEQMRNYLRSKTLYWLYDEVYNKKLPKDVEQSTIEWFSNKIK